MKGRIVLTAVFAAMLAAMVCAPAVQACPGCKDAAADSSGTGDDVFAGDPARAYNLSVMAMFAMPFALVGGLVFLAYRSCRKAQAAERGRVSAVPAVRST